MFYKNLPVANCECWFVREGVSFWVRERERERDGVSVDHVKKKECCIVSTCRWKVNLCII